MGKSWHAALLGLLVAFPAQANAQVGPASAAAAPAGDAATGRDEAAIGALLGVLRAAALASDPVAALPLLAPDMVLVSQSGKVYGRDAALADLRNRFVQWENSDIAMRRNGAGMVVSFINSRQRENMAPGKYRVLQLWTQMNGTWQLAAQASVRLGE